MPDATQRPTVCWMAYYSDFSGMAVFDNELDALRHAVGSSMDVIELGAGDVRKQVEDLYRRSAGE